MKAVRKRPPSNVLATFTDWIIELLALAMLLGCIVLVYATWARLPEIVPRHFNREGIVDGYGGKWNMLILPLIVTVFYIGLTILSRYPRAYNYIVEITDSNAQIQYQLATRLVRVLKLEVILIFFFIEGFAITAALGHPMTSAAFWFLPVTSAVLVGTLGYFLSRSIRAR